jgi:phosphoenolpyruvate synthase/pyruvate phosphate dikinase
MDIEWAKDGLNNHLAILFEPSETVHGKTNKQVQRKYINSRKSTLLTKGALSDKIASGKPNSEQSEGALLQNGEIIIVTDLTNPDWDPIMKELRDRNQ